jgi:REP element-mobilizing transposase RayT
MKRPGAFYQLIYHFVWSTKDRAPLLTPMVEGEVYHYIDLKCKELGYRLYAVNGIEDHTHALVELKPTMCPADVAKMLKGSSSHYINKESKSGATLYWQDGYGVVTLRKAEIPSVTRYIERQKEHHRTGRLSEILEIDAMPEGYE